MSVCGPLHTVKIPGALASPGENNHPRLERACHERIYSVLVIAYNRSRYNGFKIHDLRSSYQSNRGLGHVQTKSPRSAAAFSLRMPLADPVSCAAVCLLALRRVQPETSGARP